MKFASRVYAIAGLYGIAVLAPQYFLEGRLGRDFPPPITHPENFYGFIGTALAWQVLFLVLATDPARYRSMMIPTVLEKLAFGIAAVVLFLQERVSGTVLGFGTIDLLWAVLFLMAYSRTAPVRRLSQL